MEHARRYVDAITERLGLGRDSLVVELASNDGYLLQHFLPQGIPVLGVEPAQNVAEAAVARGVPTITEFFGAELGERSPRNAAARTSCSGTTSSPRFPTSTTSSPAWRRCSRPDGTATFEFPHLAKLIEHLEYDTIYHEHFSYFSLHAIRAIFGAQGLDARRRRGAAEPRRLAARVPPARRRGAQPCAAPSPSLLAREDEQGMRDPERYERFAEGVRESKRALLELLIGLRREGKQVVGYGAPGKGNTLLNYCGIRTDFLDYTVDRNPYKQGKHTPGTHIPIHPPERIAETQARRDPDPPVEPRERDQRQLAYTAEWGARLVVPDPDRTVPDCRTYTGFDCARVGSASRDGRWVCAGRAGGSGCAAHRRLSVNRVRRRAGGRAGHEGRPWCASTRRRSSATSAAWFARIAST